MTQTGKAAAVIVAAGRGERAGAGGPKQYREIGGEAIIARTLRRFAEHPEIGRIVVAVHPDDGEIFAGTAKRFGQRIETVLGGASRQESTLYALRKLAEEPPEVVLIHDAVRPFADDALITRVAQMAATGRGALPTLAVTDTLKRSQDGRIETVDRSHLFAAQTPQGFPFKDILRAHERAAAEGRSDFTDDAALVEWIGLAVAIVEGAPDNVKITYAQDIEMADRKLRSHGFPDVRTGNGYDVHAFEAGEAVVLCGVAIPHDKRLSGHSDADVGLHALTDALLATCGAGDIGTHFPPSDPQWKGAASRIFVEHAANLVRSRGGRIANADVTLICEAPKVGPHRAAMTEAMAGMLDIASDRVSVKATTNERLGFVGREEGIAAIATATVVYPGELPE